VTISIVVLFIFSNLTLSLNVWFVETLSTKFGGGGEVGDIQFSGNSTINCSAVGYPMPLVYWGEWNEFELIRTSQIGWATIQFPENVSEFPDGFRIFCFANQSRIRNGVASRLYNFSSK